MDAFYEKLKNLEQKHGLKLIFSEKEFKIKKCKELLKPFKKKDIVKAKIVCQGRFNNEVLVVAKDRLISVPNCYKEKGFVKLKIRRTKHNIFLGELLN